LLVSELVTNAVRACENMKAGRQPIVRLWLASDRNSVKIHVWDGSTHMPARQEAGPDSEAGRGLMLVESVSDDWGVYMKADGKFVWAMIGINTVAF
jgi:anti-sigma regulatory factor (Ser/Thr protein kinase)